MQKILVALIFLLALAGVLWFALTQNIRPVALPGTVPETVSTSTDAQKPEDKNISETAPGYTINVNYKLYGIPVVDAHVESEIRKAIDAFKKDAANFDPSVESRPYTFTGEVADFYSASDIVSERINLYQDTGGAHGLPIVLALNYDAKTGETITLDRALALTGHSLPEVAAQALSQLKQEFGDSVFTEGATPKPENYATFIVTPYNVTFIFQAYQVVAYAAGMPEVKFARQ